MKRAEAIPIGRHTKSRRTCFIESSQAERCDIKPVGGYRTSRTVPLLLCYAVCAIYLGRRRELSLPALAFSSLGQGPSESSRVSRVSIMLYFSTQSIKRTYRASMTFKRSKCQARGAIPCAGAGTSHLLGY